MRLKSVLKEFDKKFVKKTTKRVDGGTSIVLYHWKNLHSHQSQEVRSFLTKVLIDQWAGFREMVEEMKENNSNAWRFNEDKEMTTRAEAHNQALDQLLEKLGVYENKDLIK